MWVCWEDCERKNSHMYTPTDVAATIYRLIKKAWGGGLT